MDKQVEVHKRVVMACVWVQTDHERMDQNGYYSVMTLSDPLHFQNFYSFLFFAFDDVWALYYRMRLKKGALPAATQAFNPVGCAQPRKGRTH